MRLGRPNCSAFCPLCPPSSPPPATTNCRKYDSRNWLCPLVVGHCLLSPGLSGCNMVLQAREGQLQATPQNKGHQSAQGVIWPFGMRSAVLAIFLCPQGPDRYSHSTQAQATVLPWALSPPLCPLTWLRRCHLQAGKGCFGPPTWEAGHRSGRSLAPTCPAAVAKPLGLCWAPSGETSFSLLGNA